MFNLTSDNYVEQQDVTSGEIVDSETYPNLQNGHHNSENLDDYNCQSCKVFAKKLANCHEWLKYLKVKVMNVDKFMHILNEYEVERQKNIELQLAYDQRTREWSQQHEEYIQLLHEVLPLRERVKAAEDISDKFSQNNEKLQLCIAGQNQMIEQLNGKICEMSSLKHVSIENMTKKLQTERKGKKNLKVDLQNKNDDIHNLRVYLINRNNAFTNLYKKLYNGLGEKIDSTNIKESIDIKLINDLLSESVNYLEQQYDKYKASEMRGNQYMSKHEIHSYSDWLIEYNIVMDIKDEPVLFSDKLKTIDQKEIMKEEMYDSVATTDTENIKNKEKAVQIWKNTKIEQKTVDVIEGKVTPKTTKSKTKTPIRKRKPRNSNIKSPIRKRTSSSTDMKSPIRKRNSSSSNMKSKIRKTTSSSNNMNSTSMIMDSSDDELDNLNTKMFNLPEKQPLDSDVEKLHSLLHCKKWKTLSSSKKSIERRKQMVIDTSDDEIFYSDDTDVPTKPGISAPLIWNMFDSDVDHDRIISLDTLMKTPEKVRSYIPKNVSVKKLQPTPPTYESMFGDVSLSDSSVPEKTTKKKKLSKKASDTKSDVKCLFSNEYKSSIKDSPEKTIVKTEKVVSRYNLRHSSTRIQMQSNKINKVESCENLKRTRLLSTSSERSTNITTPKLLTTSSERSTKITRHKLLATSSERSTKIKSRLLSTSSERSTKITSNRKRTISACTLTPIKSLISDMSDSSINTIFDDEIASNSLSKKYSKIHKLRKKSPIAWKTDTFIKPTRNLRSNSKIMSTKFNDKNTSISPLIDMKAKKSLKPMKHLRNNSSTFSTTFDDENVLVSPSVKNSIISEISLIKDSCSIASTTFEQENLSLSLVNEHIIKSKSVKSSSFAKKKPFKSVEYLSDSSDNSNTTLDNEVSLITSKSPQLVECSTVNKKKKFHKPLMELRSNSSNTKSIYSDEVPLSLPITEEISKYLETDRTNYSSTDIKDESSVVLPYKKIRKCLSKQTKSPVTRKSPMSFKYKSHELSSMVSTPFGDVECFPILPIPKKMKKSNEFTDFFIKEENNKKRKLLNLTSPSKSMCNKKKKLSIDICCERKWPKTDFRKDSNSNLQESSNDNKEKTVNPNCSVIESQSSTDSPNINKFDHELLQLFEEVTSFNDELLSPIPSDDEYITKLPVDNLSSHDSCERKDTWKMNLDSFTDIDFIKQASIKIASYKKESKLDTNKLLSVYSSNEVLLEENIDMRNSSSECSKNQIDIAADLMLSDDDTYSEPTGLSIYNRHKLLSYETSHYTQISTVKECEANISSINSNFAESPYYKFDSLGQSSSPFSVSASEHYKENLSVNLESLNVPVKSVDDIKKNSVIESITENSVLIQNTKKSVSQSNSRPYESGVSTSEHKMQSIEDICSLTSKQFGEEHNNESISSSIGNCAGEVCRKLTVSSLNVKHEGIPSASYIPPSKQSVENVTPQQVISNTTEQNEDEKVLTIIENLSEEDSANISTEISGDQLNTKLYEHSEEQMKPTQCIERLTTIQPIKEENNENSAEVTMNKFSVSLLPVNTKTVSSASYIPANEQLKETVSLCTETSNFIQLRKEEINPSTSAIIENSYKQINAQSLKLNRDVKPSTSYVPMNEQIIDKNVNRHISNDLYPSLSITSSNNIADTKSILNRSVFILQNSKEQMAAVEINKLLKRCKNLQDDSLFVESLREGIEYSISEFCKSSGWKDSICNIIGIISAKLEEFEMSEIMSVFISLIIMRTRQVNALEQREASSCCPSSIYKLLQIVWVVEKNFKMAEFSLFNDLRMTCQKMIDETNLTDYSLANLSTLYFCISFIIYNGSRTPQDAEIVMQSSRQCLIQILLNYSRTCHMAIMVIVQCARFIFNGKFKGPAQSLTEKVIMWIFSHGEWNGAKLVKTSLNELLMKYNLVNDVPPKPVDIYHTAIRTVLDDPTSEVMKENSKLALRLLFHWNTSNWLYANTCTAIKQFFLTSKKCNESFISSLEMQNIFNDIVSNMKWTDKCKENFNLMIKTQIETYRK